MNDESNISELIPDYVAGKLDAESKRQVDDYLARNGETEALTARWSSIARGLREGGEILLTEHPDTSVLSRFAGSTRRHKEEDSQQIARHVETCASCSLEVAVLRDRKAFRVFRARRTKAPFAMLYRFTTVAAAAGIVLGIGLGVLFQTDGPGRGVSTGAVDLLTLDPTLRGSEGIISFEANASQPFVPVVVAPALPEEATSEERFGFSILSAGDVVWSAELTAGEIRKHLDASGVVTFLVPSTDLSAGRYALEVRSLNSPDALPLLEVPFEIR